MKNVCIVGYGAIGPTHAKALEHAKNAKLYAVCDINPEKRKKCTEQYAVKEYDDYRTMLRDKKIDSVHICTPHHLHFSMIKEALEAGKDVITEKPVTRTREEFETLLKRKDADKICVVFQNRLNPCVQKMKQLVQSGKYGKCLGARGLLTWAKDEAYYNSGDWRGKWDTEGGCLLINQAIHTLDLFQYVIGDIRDVKADMFNYSLQQVIEAEDTFVAYLQFAENIRGIFFATNSYVCDPAPLLEIVMEKTTLRYMDKQLWQDGKKIEEDGPFESARSYWGGGHMELIRQYYDEQRYFSIHDVRNTMETMFNMYSDTNEACSPKQTIAKRSKICVEITTYIQEHLSETLSAQLVAASFNISLSYLNVIFKEEMRITVKQYILNQQIILAKRLLLKGYNATETCELCGFSDYSCFLKAFKKKVGISPKQYAKLYLTSTQ